MTAGSGVGTGRIEYQATSLVPYLVKHGLVDGEAVVAGNLSVVEDTRRNRNFHVVSPPGPSYLVKQGERRPASVGSVRHEASIYRLLASDERYRDLRDSIPQDHWFDRDSDLLVLELFADATNVRIAHAAQFEFPAMLAARVGNLLAVLHRAGRPSASELLGPIPSDAPAVLSVHLPDLELFNAVSGANVALMRMLQDYPDYCEALERLRRRWEPEVLVHGDLRWDNCVVCPDGGIRLVDWEFARFGDPRWDVGFFLSEYLAFWVLAIPVIPGLDPQDMASRSPVPMGRLQPAMGAFWRAYVDGMGLEAEEEDRCLVSAVEYAAVGLIETACEQLHLATTPTTTAVFLLQLSMNILTRPREAVTQVLGIRSDG